MAAYKFWLGLLLSVSLALAEAGSLSGIAGIVLRTAPDSFVVRSGDLRVVTFKIDSSTVFYHGSRWAKQARLRRGALVAVQSSADPNGNLTADEVEFRDALPPFKSPSKVSALLPRGVTTDPVIERARHASDHLLRMLPDFLCEQSTTRSYAGPGHQWRPLDEVTAEVVYENGREIYRDVKLNGKRTGRPIMDLPGSRSTGEFSSTLRSLLDRNTAALFRFESDSILAGHDVLVYEFGVAADKSDWKITAGSQMIQSPYTGRIWIDRTSGEVLRIEMKAMDIPQTFPYQRVEAEVDYGPVPLPAGSYFLPQRAETLSCNDPQSCSRNTIEFRNYHKYVGESVIKFQTPEKP